MNRNKAKSILKNTMIPMFLLFMGSQTVYAESIQGSKIAQGTKQLISDVTNWLLILAPSVAVLCIIYFLIRKAASDELDHKKWNTRIIIAVVSAVGAVLAAVIVNLVVSYYQ